MSKSEIDRLLSSIHPVNHTMPCQLQEVILTLVPIISISLSLSLQFWVNPCLSQSGYGAHKEQIGIKNTAATLVFTKNKKTSFFDCAN